MVKAPPPFSFVARPLKKILFCSFLYSIREASKKVFFLMAGPLRPNPPPPHELNGRWNFGTLEKKGSKKSYFFLNGPALYNPPLLFMARPLREEFFFAASLRSTESSRVWGKEEQQRGHHSRQSESLASIENIEIFCI